MELISVIIPVYKVEKYLNNCVDSVVNQTYKNLEIILVDDGSPDNCPNMCEEWAKKDSRIIVIHRKNGGLSAARNSGIDIAKGEFLCFIDSDDYVDTDYIKYLYDDLKVNDSDMSICEFTNIDEHNNNLDSSFQRPKLIEKKYGRNELLSLWINYPIAPFAVAWNKLYKRELFNGLRYTEGKINEDEFIIHRIFAKCNIVSCINKPLYYYLRRKDSIMGLKFNIRRLDFLEALEDRIKLFKELNIEELVLKNQIRLVSMCASFYFNVLTMDTPVELKSKTKNKLKHLFNANVSQVLLLKNLFTNFLIKEKIHILLFYISPALYICFRKVTIIKNRLIGRINVRTK